MLGRIERISALLIGFLTSVAVTFVADACGQAASLDTNQLPASAPVGDKEFGTVPDTSSGQGVSIPCGESRTISVKGQGFAERSTTRKVRIGMNVRMPSDEAVVAYCRAHCKSMGFAVIREAKKKSLDECKRQAREITDLAYCEPVRCDTGNRGGQPCTAKPVVSRLTCALVQQEEPTCNWSGSILKTVPAYIKIPERYPSPTGKCCRTVQVGYDLTLECVVSVEEVCAEGSLTLACGAMAAQ